MAISLRVSDRFGLYRYIEQSSMLNAEFPHVKCVVKSKENSHKASTLSNEQTWDRALCKFIFHLTMATTISHQDHGQSIILKLTHWGQVTHIWIGKLTIIGSDNGLSPGRRQAIILTNARILLIRLIGTNFSEILHRNSYVFIKKIHFKLSSGKVRPFCLGLMCYDLYICGVSPVLSCGR